MGLIGRYEILGEIGRGNMGIVYLARQQGLERLAVLKRLNGNDENVAELTRRFARESQLGGSLNHPNIVTVYDYLDHDDVAYIAMEYLPGGSLRSRVGRLSPVQIVGVLDGLLAGLTAVEPAQIVHRDIKPENVLIAADGRVKIADFGLAKSSQTDPASSFTTTPGTMPGTPAYMAPEQARSGEIGPWTDLYAVGVIAYEQFVGHVPFHDSRSSIDLLMRRENEPAPTVHKSRPDLHPALSEWIARLLQRDPAERTRSALEASEQLEEIALRTLDRRWRRDARLPPLPEPETESGFHSYGQVPTGVVNNSTGSPPSITQSPPSITQSHPSITQSHPSIVQSPPSNIQSGSLRGGTPLSESQPKPPQESSHRQSAAPDPQTPSQTHRRDHWRSFSFKLRHYMLVSVLTVAAGFALALTDQGAKSPAQSSRNSSTGTTTPASNPTYDLALRNAMIKLNDVRSSAGPELKHSTSAATQAVAAERLARAHDQAAAAIGSSVPGPRERTANREIRASLTHIASGYSSMAHAARHEDRQDFENARAEVNTATASLIAWLARLERSL